MKERNVRGARVALRGKDPPTTGGQSPSARKSGVRFVSRYWHYRAKKWMIASEYGYKAWPIGKS
jgi:hypothetical protein